MTAEGKVEKAARYSSAVVSSQQRTPRSSENAPFGGRMAQLASMMNGTRVQPLTQLKVAAAQSSRVQSLTGLAAEINQDVNANSSPEREADPMGAGEMALQRQQVSGGDAVMGAKAMPMKMAAGADAHVETPLAQIAAGSKGAHPIQRVKVSVERGGNQDANVEPGGPLQRVTVTAVRAGTRISSTKLQTAIAYVTEAVRNAEEQKGKESSGDEHKRLKGLLQNEGTLKPKSSRETFGLGGAQYFPGHPFTTTQGPQGFGTSVAAIGGVGVTEHLGNRPTGLHDEMHQITNYPGLQALASTQGHCIFCYGTIHGRGYQHGEVRPDDPFPQNWKHDYAGFALKQTSENYESSIEYSDCPVIKIESTYGTRYYFVTN